MTGFLCSQVKFGKRAQHEAHRDGVVTEDNYLETRESVASRAETLLAMEQDYEGIIGSDARNLIDVLMYQAGGETFNRYVDELWSSDADYAERVINRKKIGVRPTGLFDQLKYTPGLAAGFRWAQAGLGGDVYKDYLLPESDLDSKSQVLQDLTDADAVTTQLNVIGALLGTASWAMSGGNLGKSILGLNPLDAADMLGAASALFNDATIAASFIDALRP